MAEPKQREFLDTGVLARLSQLELVARGPMEGSVSGRHQSPHRGSSVEFAEYRKYVPGDDPRHLDWRVLARSDRFYLKEFEADTNLRCYLVLDCSGSMGFGSNSETKFAYARRLAATLAYLAMLQGDAVGLSLCADELVRDIPPRRNPSHLQHIFDALAAGTPSGETGIVGALHTLAEKIRRRALVIVFSDLFCEPAGLLHCFQHLRFRKHDLAVFHLLDQTELEFQFDRPIRFVDMENGSSVVAEPGLIYPRYRAALDQYLDTMRKGCREFKVDYRLVTTDRDYEKVLADFLLARLKG
jgi:uncharacterized protein (DUF58 family)